MEYNSYTVNHYVLYDPETKMGVTIEVDAAYPLPQEIIMQTLADQMDKKLKERVV